MHRDPNTKAHLQLIHVSSLYGDMERRKKERTERLGIWCILFFLFLQERDNIISKARYKKSARIFGTHCYIIGCFRRRKTEHAILVNHVFITKTIAQHTIQIIFDWLIHVLHNVITLINKIHVVVWLMTVCNILPFS